MHQLQQLCGTMVRKKSFGTYSKMATRTFSSSDFRSLLIWKTRHAPLVRFLPFYADHLLNIHLVESFFKSKKKSPNSEHDHMSHQYREWRDLLTTTIDDYLSSDGRIYHLLHTSNMVGLFTCIYVKAELRERIRNVNSAEVKRGMGGLHGNKVCESERALSIF